MRLFIFGAGYAGKAIAREMSGGAEWIGGTTRSAEGFPALAEAGIEPFLFGGAEVTAPLAAALRETTHLMVSIAPDEIGDVVLRAAGRVIEGGIPDLRWISYLSTVGVYGDHDGAWVDEDTPCRPLSRRSIQRLAAEEEWLRTGRSRGLPVAVLRLPGIYGPGRNAFVNLEKGSARRIVKPGQVFNRVHVDDIAGAAAHLATREIGGIFNIADDQPAPPQDIVAYAAGLMGVGPPPEAAFDSADLSPMARSFYGENKRVSNARIKETGYRFRYPDYRTGLVAMWQSAGWR